MTDKVGWTKDYPDIGIAPLTERQLMPADADLTGPRVAVAAGYYTWIVVWQTVGGPAVPPALGY